MEKITMQRAELCWIDYEVEWDEDSYNEWKKWNLNLDVSLSSEFRKSYIEAIKKLIKDISWEEAAKDYKKYIDTGSTEGLLHIEMSEINSYTGQKNAIYLCHLIDEAISEDCWNSDSSVNGDALDVHVDVYFKEED